MPIHKNYDRNFFKKWSGSMSYILGFMFADGNIIKTKRGTHYISIYTSDFELLSSIRHTIKSNHMISTRNDGHVYVIQIGSKMLFDDLCKFGLVQDKTTRMKLPNIPKKYAGDFIRGFFDGDGNVWVGDLNKHRKKTSRAIRISFTSASVHFLFGVYELLRELGVKSGSVYRPKNGNWARLSYSTLDTLKIYKIMYNGSTELFLARKRAIFDNFVKMRP